jgi:probable phosphomutase (TIGR03848 family)
MTGSTTFHLIRHGDYSLLGRVLAGRMAGYSLSEKGREQAQLVAQTLAGRPVAAVVASPLERARETAAPIAAMHRLEVEIDPDVTEIDFGDWTGRSFADLHAMPIWRDFNRFRSTVPIPGGETLHAAQARGLAAIARLRSAHADRDVVIVSHGDLIKVLVAHFLGIALDLFTRIEIAPGSRSVITLYDGDVRVAGVNLQPTA